MREKIKVITGSIVLTVGAYVSAIGAFAVSVLLARFLTKELYGLYVFAISLASVCYLFTDFGLDSLTTYFVQRYKDKRLEVAKYAVTSGVKIKSILAIFVLLAMIFSGLSDKKYLYASIFFAFFTPTYYMKMFLESFQHFRLAGSLTVLESVVKLVSIYLVLTFITTADLNIIILALAFPMFICLLIGAKDVFKTISRTNSKIRFDEVKEEAFFYWKWMLFPAILSPISGNILQVLLGIVSQMSVLAIFGVGLTLSNSVRILATSFKSSMFPSFIKKTDKRDISYALTDSIRYMLLIAVFIAFLVHHVSEPLVITFYTPRYSDAAIIFEILAYGIAFSIIFVGLKSTAMSIRKPYFIVVSDLANIAPMVALAYLLIPIHNALGAAVALTTGLIVGNSYLAVAVHRSIRYKFPFKTLLRCFTASAVALLPLQLIRTGMLQSLFLNVCLGGLIYIFLLYALREINRKDVSLFKESAREILNYLISIVRH